MALRVRFQPVITNVTNAGSRFPAVTAGTLTLTTRGAPASPATPTNTTAVPAILEFFEMPGSGDTATTARSLGTLTGRFRMDGTTPKFDCVLATVQAPTLVADSDFRIALQFDATTFENAHPAARLFLPWETTAENNTLEVGVKLTIDGSVHADTAANDRLDIRLSHPNVPEDGTSTTVRSPCFGVLTVYPDDNFLFTRAQRLPVAGHPVRVFIHDSVGNACNRLRASSFSLATLTTHITTILTSGGFTAPTVTQVDDAAATAATAPWARSGGRFVAKNVTDPNNIANTDGTDMPFFDYWIFHERNVTGGAEIGQSESLNPFGMVNVAAATKRAIAPIVLPASTFDSFYGNVLLSDSMNAVADIICHEIGHSLGLRHGLAFDSSGPSYSLTGGTLLGTMTTEQVNGGRIKVKPFGPVHAGVIRRHFL